MTTHAPDAPTIKEDFESIATFRYAIRRFLRFGEQAARREGLTPQQHQLLLAIKGFPGRDSATVSELAAWLTAAMGAPIMLSSIAFRAVWMPVPNTVSGAHPTTTPAALAAVRTSRACSVSTARGFSPYTLFPAAIACSAMSACAAGMVRFSTS